MTFSNANLLLTLSDNLLFRLSNLNYPVDKDRITPSIFIAQNTDIKRILTPDLYFKILADFKANTLTDDYLVIYEDYVSLMLVYFSVADFISRNSIMVSNAGNLKNQPINSVVADYKETDRQSKYYRDLGAHFEREFYEYMKYKTNIPEYTRTSFDDESFNFGWIL